MPAADPILRPAADAPAVEASAAYRAGWNAAVEAAEKQLAVQIEVYRRMRHIPVCELAHDTLAAAVLAILALAKEPPDAP